MKPIVLPAFLLIAVSAVFASDSLYQDTLKTAHDRFAELEMLRSDYRKPQPRLSSEQEQERLRLHGQLLRDDPIWVLAEQLNTDLEALKAMSTRTESDTALIETLKNLLALVNGHAGEATTLARADEYARALRQFVVRRDYEGAKDWSTTH